MRRALILLASALAASACSRGSAPPEPAREPAEVLVSTQNANRFAEQAYLEGMRDFRQGDLGSAAEDFERCLTLGATGQTAGGCTAGLQLARAELERSASGAPRAAPAAPPAKRDDRAASQAYLEGVIFFQSGDYEKARASWVRCAKAAVPGSPTADDCRAGLDRLLKLYGVSGSTASDGKK